MLTFQTWVKGIGILHTGTHTVTVQVTSGDVLIVYLDGQQVLQYAEPGLTATALLAFTAGTNSYYEANTIRSVAISATG